MMKFICYMCLVLTMNADAGDDQNLITKHQKTPIATTIENSGDTITAIPNQFSKPLKFELVGVQVGNEAQPGCKFKSDVGKAIYESLLGSATADDNVSAGQVFRQDICQAGFYSIGEKRYLVDYRGVGILNLDSGQYSRLTGSGGDETSWTDLYFLSPQTSVAILGTVRTKYVETHTFDALIFHSDRDGRQLVQVAQLIDSSAEYVADQTGEPMCASPDENPYHGPGTPPKIATAIALPSIAVNQPQGLAQIVFQVKTKDCVTGRITSERKSFVFNERSNAMTDQKGVPVFIYNL